MNCTQQEMLSRSETVYSSGQFSYRYHYNWAKWPKRLQNQAVCSIACDSAGNVYALNRSQEAPVAVFDSQGNFLRGFGKELCFGRAHGIFITKEDKLWCCDDQNQTVYQMDLAGNLLSTLGERGRCCDNGYDPSVPWPHDLYSIKRAGEPFNRPTRMIQSPNGQLYCSDGYANVSIHRFTADGKLLQTWGGPGNGEGEFRLPHCLWADPRENIWVADRENFRVEVFTADGKFLKSFEQMLYPSEIWGLGDYVYILEMGGQISIFDLELRLVSVIGYPGSPLGQHGLGGDFAGNLYLGSLHDTAHPLSKLERLHR